MKAQPLAHEAHLIQNAVCWLVIKEAGHTQALLLAKAQHVLPLVHSRPAALPLNKVAQVHCLQQSGESETRGEQQQLIISSSGQNTFYILQQPTLAFSSSPTHTTIQNEKREERGKKKDMKLENRP